MSDFLTSEWFEETNRTLAGAGIGPAQSGEALRVVFQLEGEPSSLPHAFTFTLAPEGARVDPGDHLAAHTMIRLRYDDARRITRGDLDGATALREGLLKVRGDVNGLVDVLEWLAHAHPTSPRD